MIQGTTDKLRNIGFYIVLSVFALFCIIPIVLVLSISFSNESQLLENGYTIIPKSFSLEGYKLIFMGGVSTILNGYKISILVTTIGAFLGVMIASMIAYPLSRKSFSYRKIISFIVFFTMLFNGGLVPTYIVVTQYLHLKNNLLALILPYIANAWFIILMRTFMSQIPESLIEAATIDGATEFFVYRTIILPLSKPAIATIALFYALLYWNDWWLSLLYISRDYLRPLQLILYELMANIDFLKNQAQAGINVDIDLSSLPSESTRMAMCIIAAGPMLLIFPFFQKYFIKGLTVGSIKG